MKKCNFHTDECRSVCPGRFDDSPPRPAPLRPAPVAPVKVAGKLCGICKALYEKRSGPIEVEAATACADCDVCGAVLRNVKERNERAKVECMKPHPRSKRRE